jgi:AbrB family looped-hinge helix DNA binding protein
MATVTSKGQITLPKEVRDALGLRPGSKVQFEIQRGRVVLRRQIPQEAFDRWEGYLRGKVPASSTEELMEMLRGERLPPEGDQS